MTAAHSNLAPLRWIVIVAALGVAGCSDADRGSAEASSEAPAPAATGSQIPTGRFAGNVSETMDAAGYTYVQIESNGESIWTAGPETDLAVGDPVSVALGMRIDDFESETLGRSFPVIYFVDSFGTGGLAGQGPAGDPHAGIRTSADEASEIDADSIELPEGGHRVAELWDGRGELVDKPVVVRGQVVKYNGGILDRNWIHLRDGTGQADQGTHDITVTSSDAASVGDVVTVRGRLVADQDFGAGYTYELLVEDASVTIESTRQAGT
ncbi:MAG TPA: DNA-binding protein [bacterium]|nr:DNA-binding protein [bacterium]